MSETQIRLVNLTPHSVNLGGSMVIQPEATPVRTASKRRNAEPTDMGHPDGGSVDAYEFSNPRVVGLSEPRDGTICIVSPMVSMARSFKGAERWDVHSPHLIETVDVNGRRERCARALGR